MVVDIDQVATDISYEMGVLPVIFPMNLLPFMSEVYSIVLFATKPDLYLPGFAEA